MFSNYDGTKPYIFPFHINQLGFQDPETPSPSELPKYEGGKKKPVILESGDGKYVFYFFKTNYSVRYTGKLKFFDELKGYGFIIMDNDGSDIFCHFDDFSKAGIDINMLRSAKMGCVLRLSYLCLNYIGRHNRSRKAVDLQLLEYS